MKKPGLLNPFSALLALALLLNACGAAPAANPTPQAQTQTTQPPPPTAIASDTPVSLPAAIEMARKAAAQRSGLKPQDVQVTTYSQIEWPDSCLGFPLPDEMCAQVITPGYTGTLQAGQEQFEFHSDSTGGRLRMQPGAALAARQALAQQLGAQAEQILFGPVEATDWNNSCLGIQTGQGCADVITPGYRVTLSANGTLYEYHTDRAGKTILAAGVPAVQVNRPAVVWEQTTDSGCEAATINQDAVSFGDCTNSQTTGQPASAARKADLADFAILFASFQAETPAGKVQFTGQGPVTATPWQQRMIAAWAGLVMHEAAGRAQADEGVVIAWHRQGGTENLCQDVKVFTSGEALIQSCQDNQGAGAVQDMGRLRLTSSQLQTLYYWLDNLKHYDIERTQTFKGTNLATKLTFNGKGQTTADQNQQKDIEDLTQEMQTRANLVIAPDDLQTARQALTDYLTALSQGRYADASALYGGDYKLLRQNNPDIAKKDLAALFEAACTKNGYICTLTIKNEVSAAQISETQFRFSIEMQAQDGSLFALGPCCGADPQKEPPVTQFDFIVANVKGKMLVLSLPVYTP